MWLYRSNTRVNPGKLKHFQEYQILLRSNSYSGLGNTLNGVCCDYWVIKRRQTEMKIVSKCVICKAVQGKTLLPPSTAKLPDCRIYFEFPFENVGLDYAGPYTRNIYSPNKETYKSYVFIFTCAATRNTRRRFLSNSTFDIYKY